MANPLAPEVGESLTALAHLRPASTWPPFPRQADDLAAPTTDELAPHIADLLPRGFAWRSPDGQAFDWSSTMGRFVRGLAAGFATLYARVWSALAESTASTLAEGLADWEAEFGLPDSCVPSDPSRDARLRALLAKVRSAGTITPQDFIDLAAWYGFAITITEPLPFRAGASRCGAEERVNGGAVPSEFVWIVRPVGSAILPFRAGAARAGTTPLGEIVRNQTLECIFAKLKPAWTRVVFDYGG